MLYDSALIANKINAENAACVNKASEALDHMSAAIVLKPVGRVASAVTLSLLKEN